MGNTNIQRRLKEAMDLLQRCVLDSQIPDKRTENFDIEMTFVIQLPPNSA